MKNWRCDRTSILPFAGVALVLMLVAWPAVGGSRRGAGQDDPWARYDIILKRNIFSRDRMPERPQEARDEPRDVVVPNPESYYILKGLVQEDSEFIAFVEDKRAGAILRLHEGDSVARGTVQALSLDTLVYEMGEQTITIRLGSDLEGGYGAVTSADLMEWSQTPRSSPELAPGGEEPPPSADEADILRRLMEQRKQQLGQ